MGKEEAAVFYAHRSATAEATSWATYLSALDSALDFYMGTV